MRCDKVSARVQPTLHLILIDLSPTVPICLTIVDGMTVRMILGTIGMVMNLVSSPPIKLPISQW